MWPKYAIAATLLVMLAAAALWRTRPAAPVGRPAVVEHNRSRSGTLAAGCGGSDAGFADREDECTPWTREDPGKRNVTLRAAEHSAIQASSSGARLMQNHW